MSMVLGLLFSAVVLWFGVGWLRRELPVLRPGRPHGSIPEPDRPLTNAERTAWLALAARWDDE